METLGGGGGEASRDRNGAETLLLRYSEYIASDGQGEKLDEMNLSISLSFQSPKRIEEASQKWSLVEN